MVAGNLQSRHDLPVDIQQDVEAVKQARKFQKLPWAGMQLDASYLQRHQLQEGLTVEGSELSARDETTRCTSLPACRLTSLSQCIIFEGVHKYIDGCWLAKQLHL